MTDFQLYNKIMGGNVAEIAKYATQEKVSISDFEQLKIRTFLYLRACVDTATYPTSKGFARSIGYTPQALRYWRNKKKDTLQGQWLDMFADLCADITIQSGLQGNANPTSVKFITYQHLKYINKQEDK